MRLSCLASFAPLRLTPPANEGAVRELGVRVGFWLTIVAAIGLVILFLRGYWEWAVVGLIALTMWHRLPYVRWR